MPKKNQKVEKIRQILFTFNEFYFFVTKNSKIQIFVDKNREILFILKVSSAKLLSF